MHEAVIETQMQRQEEKIDIHEVVDAGLVVTESNGTKPDKQDTSSSSGNYTTQAVDADIRPVNDKEPFAEVQLTALHNILANEQQHTEQSEPNYDTHMLETIDSNTTPTSKNMCHRGGVIDPGWTLLNAEFKTKILVVQIILWYLDSGCSKHMTRNRSKLKNFVEKFFGTVRFGNDHVGAIMGYGDYMIGDSVISRVYYVEGLGHNLFSVGQFCDSNLEVAFKKHSCFVRNMDGVDLLKGCRSTNLYTISVDEMLRSSPICLLSKASKSKSW
ncbi:hypothetical protein Tco_0173683 [Tanacetum coccineum]